MNGNFVIHSTPGFNRVLKKLSRKHPDLPERIAEIFAILQSDPYNASLRHPIRKLVAVPPGQGQYRIRSGRFRIRYDIGGGSVELVYCGLRREDTYR